MESRGESGSNSISDSEIAEREVLGCVSMYGTVSEQFLLDNLIENDPVDISNAVKRLHGQGRLCACGLGLWTLGPAEMVQEPNKWSWGKIGAILLALFLFGAMIWLWPAGLMLD